MGLKSKINDEMKFGPEKWTIQATPAIKVRSL